MNRSYSKIRHIQESNIKLEQRLLKEQPVPPPSKGEGSESSENSNIKTVTNKVASEGIKNVTEQMISAPPFEGTYSGYVFGGTFNGVRYEWDCNGIEGMSGVRGMVDGKIITEHNSYLLSDDATRIGLKDDANPEGLLVGFVSTNTKFVIYYSKDKKYKCKYFR